MSGSGSNSGEDLKRRVEAMVDLLAQATELRDELAALKQQAKDDGYDLKALMRVVRERCRTPKQIADQLQFELVLDTYRSNAGLPVTLEDAQARVRDAAAGAVG